MSDPTTPAETPRTNLVAKRYDELHGDAPDYVSGHFARQLERELAAALAAKEQLERERDLIRAHFREFTLNVAGPAWTREELHKEANSMPAHFDTYGKTR